MKKFLIFGIMILTVVIALGCISFGTNPVKGTPNVTITVHNASTVLVNNVSTGLNQSTPRNTSVTISNGSSNAGSSVGSGSTLSHPVIVNNTTVTKGNVSNLPTISVATSGPAAVNLGTAGNFVILSKSGISTTGTTLITGDIGVSPIDRTALTGFSETMDSTNTFSKSIYVIGKLYAADYTPPTPTKMTTAVSDMEIAFTNAAGRTNPTATELGAGDISGMTITPGLYKWGTGVLINGGITLNCNDNTNAVFIFQIGQDFTVGNGAIVTLSGGCQAKNIFWQVDGQATLGTTSNVKGNILSQTLIEMNTGAKLTGRALAQTAVTLDANTVTKV